MREQPALYLPIDNPDAEKAKANPEKGQVDCEIKYLGSIHVISLWEEVAPKGDDLRAAVVRKRAGLFGRDDCHAGFEAHDDRLDQRQIASQVLDAGGHDDLFGQAEIFDHRFDHFAGQFGQ